MSNIPGEGVCNVDNGVVECSIVGNLWRMEHENSAMEIVTLEKKQ